MLGYQDTSQNTKILLRTRLFTMVKKEEKEKEKEEEKEKERRRKVKADSEIYIVDLIKAALLYSVWFF